MRARFLASCRLIAAITVLVAALAWGRGRIQAQGSIHTEELALPLGAVLEVLAQEGSPQTQYAWVLSFERTFLQASRGRIFRTRFSQPGKYQLSAEVSAPGRKSVRGSFTIAVSAQGATASASTELLETIPPAMEEVIALGDATRLIVIRPLPGMLRGLMLDADLNSDEDGDGNASNDRSAEGSFLPSEGLPLHLWVTGELPASFGLTGQQLDGTPYARQITATAGPAPSVPSPEPAPTAGDIAFTEQADGSLRLRVQDAPADAPILPLWDFGDGAQSMLMEPAHRYSASGAYVVSVRLKDLRNGIVIRDLRDTVMVRAARMEPEPETPAPAPETPTQEQPFALSSLLPLILKLLAGLVAAGILGMIVTVLAAKLRKGKSFAERLEEADKNMAINKERPGSAPPPMALPSAPGGPSSAEEIPKKPSLAPTPVPVPLSIQAPKHSAPTAAEPGIPEWLAPAAPKSAAAPIFPPQAPKPQTPKAVAAFMEPPKTAPALMAPSTPAISTPAPTAPFPAKTPPPQAPDTSLPPWLQQQSSSSAAPAVAASTPSAPPMARPAPGSPAAPTELPAAPVAPKALQDPQGQGTLPPWLQPQPPKPATSPAPQATLATSAATAQPTVPSAAPMPSATLSPAHTAQSFDPSTKLRTGSAQDTPPQSSQRSSSPASVQPTTPTDKKPINDKERERRRLKRQRYRQNKAKREAVATESIPGSPAQSPRSDDAPVAFIRADNIKITPNQNANPNPDPNPDPNPNVTA